MDPAGRARRTGRPSASTTPSASGRRARSCSSPTTSAASSPPEPPTSPTWRASSASRPSGTPGCRWCRTPARTRCPVRSRRASAGSSGPSPQVTARPRPSPSGARTTADGVRYQPDPRRLGQFLSVTIPYPTSPAPGVRIRVRLLNGTEDPALTERAARALVSSGAAVAVVGNASTFAEPETRFVLRGSPGGPGPLAAGELRLRAPRTGRRRAGWGDVDRRRHRRDRDPRPRCRGHPREGADP